MQHEKVSSSVSKLVNEVISDCEYKISKLKEELTNANKTLEETEAMYQKDRVLHKQFENKIRLIKTKRENLEEEINNNKAKITQMNNFNEEVLRILKSLDEDIKTYVQDIADLKKEINDEKLALKREIQQLKTKNLENEKLKNKALHAEKQLRKENEELRTLLESLKKEQQIKQSEIDNNEYGAAKDSPHFNKDLHDQSTKDDAENIDSFVAIDPKVQIQETPQNLSQEETLSDFNAKSIEIKEENNLG